MCERATNQRKRQALNMARVQARTTDSHQMAGYVRGACVSAPPCPLPSKACACTIHERRLCSLCGTSRARLDASGTAVLIIRALARRGFEWRAGG
ncbi:unnamed protein product [Mesocestoides corti]|uniref:Nuclear receptor domain-containing protein n=1 Tax=Mesocestoides corti TaxID=53468 RepID=A0A0R3U2H8_MESCO|nr:unnamed protein product [Mesocestoides corti]